MRPMRNNLLKILCADARDHFPVGRFDLETGAFKPMLYGCRVNVLDTRHGL
jgi:hypothetical protein